MLDGTATRAYTDFTQFAEMRRDAQQAPNASLEEVAKQFESIFINMLLKSMRDASFGDSLFDSNQSEFYQDMFDKQISLDMSKDKGIGLADSLIQQMRKYVPVDKDNIPLLKTRVDDPFILNRESTQFKTHDEFVNTLLPYAEEAAQQLGLDPKVLIAQSALETGWGKSIGKLGNGQTSYNLFNIKATANHSSNQYSKKTVEYADGIAKIEKASFRAYNNYQESFEDYVNLIKDSPRYQQALSESSDSKRYLDGIQQAGYATDPRYSEKVNRVLESLSLENDNFDDDYT